MCVNGYRARFYKAQDLFDELYASLADRSTSRLLKRLSHYELLAVDELGYLNLKPEKTNAFFKLMDLRYGRRPSIITTNKSRLQRLVRALPAQAAGRCPARSAPAPLHHHPH